MRSSSASNMLRFSSSGVLLVVAFIFLDEFVNVVDREGGVIAVFGRVFYIIYQLCQRTRCHVQACIRRSVVDIHLAIVVGNPTVTENDIGDIAETFLALRCEEIARRFMDDAGRVVECRHEQIEYISQSGGGAAYAMGEVDPPFGCF